MKSINSIPVRRLTEPVTGLIACGRLPIPIANLRLFSPTHSISN
jgi:hypothetical protein